MKISLLSLMLLLFVPLMGTEAQSPSALTVEQYASANHSEETPIPELEKRVKRGMTLSSIGLGVIVLALLIAGLGVGAGLGAFGFLYVALAIVILGSILSIGGFWTTLRTRKKLRHYKEEAPDLWKKSGEGFVPAILNTIIYGSFWILMLVDAIIQKRR